MNIDKRQAQPAAPHRTMPTCISHHIAFALAISFCQLVHADDSAPPTAILVGNEVVAAELKSIEANGDFRFASSSGERVITKDALVRWGNPVAPSGARFILLAEGSEIAASEWAIGRETESLRLEGDTLTFKPSLFDSVSLRRHMVRAVVLKLPADAQARDRFLASIRTSGLKEDAVITSGGDRLTGHVTRIDGRRVAIETAIGLVEAPVTGVDAILFDSPTVEATAAVRDCTYVGLSDGSVLAVREFGAEGDNIWLKLDGDVELRGGKIENIVSLQPFGGGVTYLSDVKPYRFEHVPYLDLKWPLGRDRNVVGGRLRAGGKRFSKGLGVHSEARLVYRLDGKHDHFAAMAAVDDSAGRGGSVVFRVLLTEGESWREAYASRVIRGGDEPVPVYVPLAGAKGLALVVDYADRGDELDHADWLDARLE